MLTWKTQFFEKTRDKFQSIPVYLGNMHKIKNHIADNFRPYFVAVFTLQWIGFLGFLGWGLMGDWFFSLICLLVSFGFYIGRIVLKKNAMDSIVHRITKKRDPFAMLKFLPLDGRKRRNIKRQTERKANKLK